MATQLIVTMLSNKELDIELRTNVHKDKKQYYKANMQNTIGN